MSINFSNVKRIYVGRDSGCRCGCNGAYHEEGSRGFKMAINRAQMLIKLNPDAVNEQTADYANVISGEDRAITLYFAD